MVEKKTPDENKGKHEQDLPECCKPAKKYKGSNPLAGIAYGIIPHIGCILFIIGAVLGTTVLMQFFKPFLMNRNIFYYLIAISIGFATLSSVLYLRKNKMLSLDGIKKKKGYLSIMYGTTVGINIALFFFIFPLVSSMTGGVSAEQVATAGNSTFRMTVDIPCPGHAPLITNELKTAPGVIGSQYSFPNKFDVYYDPAKTSEKQILGLDIFKEFKATVIK